MLTNAAKNCPWVSYTFPQKPRSFKRFSILEENCGADIINVTFKCKTFVNKGSKTCSWVSYTFLQKPCSFKHFSILEENCVADIINVTFKCDLFVDRYLKTCRWVSYTFLEKPSLLNHFWIWGNFFLFENQRFWRNQYLKVLMASKCDENKNWLSKTQKKSKCKFGKIIWSKC